VYLVLSIVALVVKLSRFPTFLQTLIHINHILRINHINPTFPTLLTLLTFPTLIPHFLHINKKSLFLAFMTRLSLVSLFFVLLFACRPKEYTPKPPGYFRIDTPATHRYQLFDRPGFPYSFEYPVYGSIEQDTISDAKKERHPFWINVTFPKLGGAINITYKEISAAEPLSKMSEDSWRLSFVHHEKADFMYTKDFYSPSGVTSQLYYVGGNTASCYQFVANDSTKHFMRGALYFDVTPNADSLKPATDFLEKDIEHLLMTLKWK
jgi:gliding motility-associated lipoprotein GldD